MTTQLTEQIDTAIVDNPEFLEQYLNAQVKGQHKLHKSLEAFLGHQGTLESTSSTQSDFRPLIVSNESQKPQITMQAQLTKITDTSSVDDSARTEQHSNSPVKGQHKTCPQVLEAFPATQVTLGQYINGYSMNHHQKYLPFPLDISKTELPPYDRKLTYNDLRISTNYPTEHFTVKSFTWQPFPFTQLEYAQITGYTFLPPALGYQDWTPTFERHPNLGRYYLYSSLLFSKYLKDFPFHPFNLQPEDELDFLASASIFAPHPCIARPIFNYINAVTNVNTDIYAEDPDITSEMPDTTYEGDCFIIRTPEPHKIKYFDSLTRALTPPGSTLEQFIAALPAIDVSLPNLPLPPSHQITDMATKRVIRHIRRKGIAQSHVVQQEAIEADTTDQSSKGFIVQDNTTHLHLEFPKQGVPHKVLTATPWDFQSWQDKARRIATWSWTAALPAGTVFKLPFPQSITTTYKSITAQLIEQHARISGYPEYELFINSTVFHAGLIRFAIIPDANDLPSDAEIYYRVQTGPSLEFDASQPGAQTLSINQNWVNPQFCPNAITGGNYATQHTLVGVVIAPLILPPTATQAVQISVYYRWKNLKLYRRKQTQPSFPASILFTYPIDEHIRRHAQTQGQLISKPIEAVTGIIKPIAGAINDAIDPIKQISEGVGGVIEPVKELLPLIGLASNPVVAMSGSQVGQPHYARGLTSRSGQSDHIAHTTSPTYSEIGQMKTVNRTFVWSTTQTVGTTIATFSPTPIYLSSATGSPMNAISFFANTHSFARGDMFMHFKIIKNKFVNGRLAVILIPPQDDNSAIIGISTEDDNYETYILDAGENSEASIRIPYPGSKPYMDLPQARVRPSSNSSSSFIYGKVLLKVLNPLISNSPDITSVRIVVYTNYEKDLHLYDPGRLHGGSNTPITLMTSADAPFFAKIRERNEIQRAGSAIAQQHRRRHGRAQMMVPDADQAEDLTKDTAYEEVAAPDESDSPVSITEPANHEETTNAVQILTRNRCIASVPCVRGVTHVSFAPSPTLMGQCFRFIQNVPTVFDIPMDGILEHMSMFALWRGSFHYDIIAASTKNDRAFLVIHFDRTEQVIALRPFVTYEQFTADTFDAVWNMYSIQMNDSTAFSGLTSGGRDIIIGLSNIKGKFSFSQPFATTDHFKKMLFNSRPTTASTEYALPTITVSLYNFNSYYNDNDTIPLTIFQRVSDDFELAGFKGTNKVVANPVTMELSRGEETASIQVADDLFMTQQAFQMYLESGATPLQCHMLRENVEAFDAEVLQLAIDADESEFHTRRGGVAQCTTAPPTFVLKNTAYELLRDNPTTFFDMLDTYGLVIDLDVPRTKYSTFIRKFPLILSDSQWKHFEEHYSYPSNFEKSYRSSIVKFYGVLGFVQRTKTLFSIFKDLNDIKERFNISMCMNETTYNKSILDSQSLAANSFYANSPGESRTFPNFSNEIQRHPALCDMHVPTLISYANAMLDKVITPIQLMKYLRNEYKIRGAFKDFPFDKEEDFEDTFLLLLTTPLSPDTCSALHMPHTKRNGQAQMKSFLKKHVSGPNAQPPKTSTKKPKKPSDPPPPMLTEEEATAYLESIHETTSWNPTFSEDLTVEDEEDAQGFWTSPPVSEIPLSDPESPASPIEVEVKVKKPKKKKPNFVERHVFPNTAGAIEENLDKIATDVTSTSKNLQSTSTALNDAVSKASRKIAESVQDASQSIKKSTIKVTSIADKVDELVNRISSSSIANTFFPADFRSLATTEGIHHQPLWMRTEFCRFITARVYELVCIFRETDKTQAWKNLIIHTLIDLGLNFHIAIKILQTFFIPTSSKLSSDSMTRRGGRTQALTPETPGPGLLQAIVASIGATITSSVPDQSTIGKCIKKLGDRGRSIANIDAGARGWENIIDRLSGLVTRIAMFFLGEHYTEIGAAFMLQDKLEGIVDWTGEVLDLEEAQTIYLAVRNVKYKLRIESLARLGHEYEEIICKQNIRSTVVATIRDQNKKLARILAGIFAGCKNDFKRYSPFTVFLAGPSGIGKSFITEQLIMDIANSVYLDPHNLLYSRCNTDHWDNYHDQWATYFDDFGQDNEDTEFIEFLKLVSNTAYILPMASIESKGTAFRSDFIMATTNVPDYSPRTVKYPPAYFRRRNLVVNVRRVGPKDGTNNLEFQIRRPTQEYHYPVYPWMNNMNYTQFRQFLRDSMLRHFEEQYIGFCAKNQGHTVREYPKPDQIPGPNYVFREEPATRYDPKDAITCFSHFKLDIPRAKSYLEKTLEKMTRRKGQAQMMQYADDEEEPFCALPTKEPEIRAPRPIRKLYHYMCKCGTGFETSQEFIDHAPTCSIGGTLSFSNKFMKVVCGIKDKDYIAKIANYDVYIHDWNNLPNAEQEKRKTTFRQLRFRKSFLTGIADLARQTWLKVKTFILSHPKIMMLLVGAGVLSLAATIKYRSKIFSFFGFGDDEKLPKKTAESRDPRFESHKNIVKKYMLPRKVAESKCCLNLIAAADHQITKCTTVEPSTFEKAFLLDPEKCPRCTSFWTAAITHGNFKSFAAAFLATIHWSKGAQIEFTPFTCIRSEFLKRLSIVLQDGTYKQTWLNDHCMKPIYRNLICSDACVWCKQEFIPTTGWRPKKTAFLNELNIHLGPYLEKTAPTEEKLPTKLAQSYIDPNAHAIAMSLYENTFVITNLNTRQRQNATCIGRDILVLNRHFFRGATDGDVITLTGDMSKVSSFTFEHANILNPQVLDQGSIIDEAWYRVGKDFMPKKTITHHFVHEKDLAKASGKPYLFLGRTTDSRIGIPMLHGGFGIKLNLIPETYESYLGDAGPNDNTRIDYCVLKNYTYQGVPMGPGDCGSLLLVQSNSMPQKILGFHAAGVSGETAQEGIAFIITQEKAAKYLAMSSASYGIPTPTCDWESAYDRGIVSIPSDSALQVVGLAPPELTVRIPTKTKLCQSAIHGTFLVRSGPSVLSPRDPRYKGSVPPLQQGVNGWAKPAKPFPPRLIKKAFEYKVLRNEALTPRGFQRRLLTWDETVNGPKEISALAKPIDMNTSPGLPYVNQNLPGDAKHCIFDNTGTTLEPHYEMKPFFRCIVEHREANARKGIRVPSTWFDMLKDEKRPLEKIKEGKTRNFVIGPADYTVLFRKYFYAFQLFMQEQCVQHPNKVGLNPLGGDWGALHARMAAKGVNVIAGDYKNFDRTQNARLVQEFADIANRWYNDSIENQRVRSILMEEACFRLTVCGNVLYLTGGGNPSGLPATTPVNGNSNETYHIVGWLEIWEAFQKGIPYVKSPEALAHFSEAFSKKELFADMADPQAYHDNNELATYGDDIFNAVTTPASKVFNFESYQTFLAKYDITFTPEDKSTTIQLYKNIHEATFLKRKFISDDYITFAPIEWEVIEEECNWIHSGGDNNEMTRQVCEASLRESFQHGRSIFENHKNTLNNALIKKDIKPLYLDYDSLMKTHLSFYGI